MLAHYPYPQEVSLNSARDIGKKKEPGQTGAQEGRRREGRREEEGQKKRKGGKQGSRGRGREQQRANEIHLAESSART